ncbi:MAG: ABC transporter permease/substrate-binding protein [Acidobacteria bacterium]|nr:ABC transporter permease/substrate-binding protein [Acidobacteriota bacterium]
MSEQLALLPEYLTAHLQLSLLAVLSAAALSLPAGIVATRVRWLEQPLLALAGVIQTIPSLALLAVMVPVLASMQLQSIGFLPAFIGLTLYGVLPILRNTVTGIAGVDPALREAARGVGMTARQQLWRVEFPLALPVIIAGLRTATVWIVGIATLSTPVGATSLGNYIFTGLQTRNYAAVLVGCVGSAGLAMLLDGLVRMAEVGLRTRRRRLVGVAATLTAGLYLFTAVTLAAPLFSDAERPVRIGAKGITEQYILASLLGQWIERETGRSTTQMQALGSTVAFDALAAGEIDIYVDYSGTLLALMDRASAGGDRATVLAEVEDFLADEHDITVAATLGFENAYVLAAREPDAERMGLTRISDLIPLGPTLSMGGDFEFFSRPEWVSIRDTYGLALADQRTMDGTLMYEAIAQEAVDLISAYTTDGRIAAYDLRVLQDDRGAIPPYDAMVLVGPRLVREWPDVLAALARLDGAIDIDAMRGMNLRVDVEGIDPTTVAAAFVTTLADTR